MTRRRRGRRSRKSRGWNPVKHPGSLKRLGYSTTESAEKRHRALKRAVKLYGYDETIHKLSFLKGAARIPKRSKKNVAEDIDWLKRHYK